MTNQIKTDADPTITFNIEDPELPIDATSLEAWREIFKARKQAKAERSLVPGGDPYSTTDGSNTHDTTRRRTLDDMRRLSEAIKVTRAMSPAAESTPKAPAVRSG